MSGFFGDYLRSHFNTKWSLETRDEGIFWGFLEKSLQHKMGVHGDPCISIDIHGIHGYRWISMDIHGYP